MKLVSYKKEMGLEVGVGSREDRNLLEQGGPQRVLLRSTSRPYLPLNTGGSACQGLTLPADSARKSCREDQEQPDKMHKGVGMRVEKHGASGKTLFL